MAWPRGWWWGVVGGAGGAVLVMLLMVVGRVLLGLCGRVAGALRARASAVAVQTTAPRPPRRAVHTAAHTAVHTAVHIEQLNIVHRCPPLPPPPTPRASNGKAASLDHRGRTSRRPIIVNLTALALCHKQTRPNESSLRTVAGNTCWQGSPLALRADTHAARTQSHAAPVHALLSHCQRPAQGRSAPTIRAGRARALLLVRERGAGQARGTACRARRARPSARTSATQQRPGPWRNLSNSLRPFEDPTPRISKSHGKD